MPLANTSTEVRSLGLQLECYWLCEIRLPISPITSLLHNELSVSGASSPCDGCGRNPDTVWRHTQRMAAFIGWAQEEKLSATKISLQVPPWTPCQMHFFQQSVGRIAKTGPIWQPASDLPCFKARLNCRRVWVCMTDLIGTHRTPQTMQNLPSDCSLPTQMVHQRTVSTRRQSEFHTGWDF